MKERSACNLAVTLLSIAVIALATARTCAAAPCDFIQSVDIGIEHNGPVVPVDGWLTVHYQWESLDQIPCPQWLRVYVEAPSGELDLLVSFGAAPDKLYSSSYSPGESGIYRTWAVCEWAHTGYPTKPSDEMQSEVVEFKVLRRATMRSR